MKKYNSDYAFSFENMRNIKFKEFKQQYIQNERFFLGSNKAMQVALGRSASDGIRHAIFRASRYAK